MRVLRWRSSDARHVVGPGEPEEVALLLAGRVVGQLVEQVVEHVEALRELRLRRGEVGGGRAQRGDRRLRDLARTGRSWFSMIGWSPCEALERLRATGARPSRRGCSSSSVGPSTSAERLGVLAAPRSSPSSAAGQLPERLAQALLRVGEGAEDRGWRSRRTRRAACRGCRAPRRAGGSCGSSAGCTACARRAARELGGVARDRLEALERRREVRGVAVEPLARAAEQQLQVVARVDVERGEDLVGVDVRQRLRDRDDAALRQLARASCCPGRARSSCRSGRSSGASRTVASL